jgi:hypothetical protein
MTDRRPGEFRTELRSTLRPEDTTIKVIAVLRAMGLPYKMEHADHLEQQLEQHGPDERTVRLILTDDVFLRSYTWAR